LEEAVKKACMESRQSGKSVATELSTMISPMVAELQKIVLSETASIDEKLQAAALAQKILSKAVLAEISTGKTAATRAHIGLQKDLLTQRRKEQSDKRAKRQAKVAQKLAETEQQLGGLDGIITN
jgi:hypothetical protein